MQPQPFLGLPQLPHLLSLVAPDLPHSDQPLTFQGMSFVGEGGVAPFTL